MIATSSENSVDTLSDDRLVIFRIRSMAEKEAGFYDPAADCRYILPGLYRQTVATLSEVLQGEEKRALEMVMDFGTLIKARLVEEPETLDKVIHTYLEEFYQIPVEVRALFSELFLLHSLATYGLMLRRECNNDKGLAREVFSIANASTVLSLLTPETAEKVKKELRAQANRTLRELSVPATTDIVWAGIQDGPDLKVLENDIKNFALSYIKVRKADGSQVDWNTLSKLLDKAAGACEKEDPVKAEILRQAFPGYFAGLACEKTQKGSRWKNFWRHTRDCLKSLFTIGSR